LTARGRGNIISAVSVEIRDFEKPSDYEACAQLQVDIWGFSAADAVPPLHLIAMHHYGGILVGAFEAEQMVGFVCGFSGWDQGRVFHHSHMLGVLAEHRGSGLGEKLKWAQRERVLAQGIELVNWTFDPLQAVNANLNVNRLAAQVGKYRVNIYGESKSKLHGSLPTDRFEAEWLLSSERVTKALRGELPEWPGWEDLPRANATSTAKSGLPVSAEADIGIDEDALLAEIPESINRIMAEDKDLALDWRLKIRNLFRAYFERGYWVKGFHRSEEGTFYRLEREEAPAD
jgi:predicted GNAT superfamily acetyltransferase